MIKVRIKFLILAFIVVYCLWNNYLFAMTFGLVQQRFVDFKNDYPVAMTTDSSLNIVVAFNSGEVKLLGSMRGLEGTFFTTGESIDRVQFVMNGILYKTNNGVHFFWQANQGNLVSRFLSTQNPINSVIGLANHEFVFAYQDGTIEVVESSFKKIRLRFRGHENGFISIIQLNDGLIVSGSEDGRIIVWNLNNGQEYWSTKLVDKRICSLISTGKNNFVSVCDDGTIMLWRNRANAWLCKKIMMSNDAFCSSSKFIVSWPYLITPMPNGVLRVYFLHFGWDFKEFLVTNGSITSIVSLGNNLFAVGTSDGLVRVFSVTCGNWA